jgi:prepilin-type N-terminal cleavage/methylation domain-containing protein
MRARRAARGLTLLEVLIASAIAAVLALAVTETWFTSDRVYRTGNNLSQAQAGARRAMQRLEHEIRSGSRSSLDSSVLPSELKFRSLLLGDTSPTAIRYYRDANGNLVRETAGGSSIVATDVSVFEIVSASGEAITVRVEIEVDEQEAALETKIGFRNP